MGLIKYIVIIIMVIIGLCLMVFIMYRTYKTASKRFDETGSFKSSKKKYKCAVGVCEIIINITKTDSRFCDFHTKIQKFHLDFIKNKDKKQNITSMYMNTNGFLYNTENKREKIYKKLRDASNKVNERLV